MNFDKKVASGGGYCKTSSTYRSVSSLKLTQVSNHSVISHALGQVSSYFETTFALLVGCFIFFVCINFLLMYSIACIDNSLIESVSSRDGFMILIPEAIMVGLDKKIDKLDWMEKLDYLNNSIRLAT